MAYASLTVEGGLFPADLLDRIAAGDVEGQRAADFRVNGTRRLADEIQSAFSDGRSFWDAFQGRLRRSRESKTTITREAWMAGFFELLGFDQLVLQRASAEVGGQLYFMSHRAGDDPDAPPVHIVAIDQELDRRNGARRSPHALIQEYLNRSDALWGLVTNGRRLRLLRDSARLSKPTYLEFDLEGMIGGNLYSEFVLLYRLVHASRFPRDGASAHECLLERYYQQGIDEGGRVRDKLRDGVEDALKVLGSAFLAHPESGALREKSERGQLDAPKYYRQLLRLVYRFLFLMVAEERRLIFPPDDTDTTRQAVYSKYYSVARLRDRAERYFAGDRNGDLWLGLRETFRFFRDNDAAKQLGLRALDGELFGRDACADLEGAGCSNEQLLTAIRCLSTFVDEDIGRRRSRSRGQRRRVNYAGLDVEEFGSVYESLLDYHPQVTLEPPAFDLVVGGERKQTGSYYTPPELVRELVESALVPVMEDRLAEAKTSEEKERALLALNVCDPASGSGHFLLAAARRIARELARVRTHEDEPPPESYRVALRDVIRTCVYAVDKNPLAVDLCKVALWIEGHNAGLPLSFLDQHVKCGDSLVGVADLVVLEQGIPDDAYKPVTGDDKAAATHYRKRNKQEREGQLRMEFEAASPEGREAMAHEFDALAAQEERTPDDVHAKEELYESLRRQGSEWWELKVACDLWTAAFFTPLALRQDAQPDVVPTTDTVRRYLTQPNAAYAPLVAQAMALSQEHPFFHWPLEFPEVFSQGGFDAVLGNPPWEQLQPEETKFFAAIGADHIAKLPGARRKAAIDRLTVDEPDLARAWDAHRRLIEEDGRFVRASGRFPLSAVGKLNTYALFAELDDSLHNERGRAGFIVPTGIATDDTCKQFFSDLNRRRALASLYDFENRTRKLFPAIDSRVKFSLVTLTGPALAADGARFAFFLLAPEELREEERRFLLTPEDLALLNPNTRTCPIFRSRRDAEITKAIYRRVPLLIKEGPPEENPWGMEFRQGLFNMTSDSHLFCTRAQLEAQGFRLEGNVFARGGERYLPLYEAKLLHQFDHRWATYDGADTRDLSPAEKDDPGRAVLPRYWVPEAEVEARLAGRWGRGWLLGWRNICRSTDERTVIASVLPRVGVGHSFPLALIRCHDGDAPATFTANLSVFVLDFICRQKLGGTNLTYGYLTQLPVLPPDRYDRPCSWSPAQRLAEWIAPRVLELTYTAWDVQPFAQDCGYDCPPFRWDEERRFALRCELDAAFFHLYGIPREDVEYVMESFWIVRRKDERQHGHYRTKRLILEIYDEMARAAQSGEPYRTRLDPPPADPRVAHTTSARTL